MALTIAQHTNQQTITPTVTTEIGIRAGYQVNDTTSGAVGMIGETVWSGFGEGTGVSTMNVIVLSGTFSNGDSCTTANGASFIINTVVANTRNGIIVDGTMSDSDSTINTNEALDATENEITTTTGSVLKQGIVVRVGTEYMTVIGIISATSIRVIRGMFGTATTHLTGQDIHIVDTDLYEQILDADVAGGWGYSDTSNGRLEFDCDIILSKTNISTPNYLISESESIDLGNTGNVYYSFGNITTPNRAYIQYGIGYLDMTEGSTTGFGANGCIVKGNFGDSTVIGMYSFTGSTVYYFDTTLKVTPNLFGGGVGYGATFNDIDSVLFFWHRSAEYSKFYKTRVNFTSLDPSSPNIEIIDLYSYNPDSSTFYWVYSNEDVTFRDTTRDVLNGAGAGFASGGERTLINYNGSIGFGIFFGTGSFENYKTFDCKVCDEFGNLLENAQVECHYRIDSTANIFTELTDSNGVIDQQEIKFASVNASGGAATLTRNIEYIITKSGYKTLRGRIYIENDTEAIKLEKTLKPNRYIEKQSN